MYELLVLSLLMHWPLHAYRIAKIANEIIGPEDQISTGTLSTLLSKLAQTGLITPADPGMTPFSSDRPSRVFAITPAGRERFFELMLETASHPGNYRRLFHIKALHLSAPGVIAARKPGLPGGTLYGLLPAISPLQTSGRAGCI